MVALDETSLVERVSMVPFDLTVERLSVAIAEAGMTIFAVIDHARNATEAGLNMPASVVLIYGAAAGGTPVMLASPRSALDLPLRVLVRQSADGKAIISFHPIAAVLEVWGAPTPLAARLESAQDVLLKALEA